MQPKLFKLKSIVSILFVLVLSISVYAQEKSVKIYIGVDLPDSEIVPLNKKDSFKRGIIHFIPSNHQDIGWEDALWKCIAFRDENVISPALEMMKTNPHYHYSVESALSFYEYIERLPERNKFFTYIQEVCLECRAYLSQPYLELFTGEALVHQFYLGNRKPSAVCCPDALHSIMASNAQHSVWGQCCL